MKSLIAICVVAIFASSARADFYSVGQTCQGGKCGPVQQTGLAVVQYAGNVVDAVVAPAKGWHPLQDLADKIRERRAERQAKKCGGCR